jgi:DNA-binding XRE family transcriptional regulator
MGSRTLARCCAQDGRLKPVSLWDIDACKPIWVKWYSYINFMGTMMSTIAAPLEVASAVQRLGENIRLARVRRRLSQQELAQACGITRKTLYALEKGTPGATIATVFTVLWKLGLLSTAAALADPDTDEHGKILEAARRPKRVRQPVEIDNDF